VAITVYWACVDDAWIKAEEPERVSNRFYSLGIKDNDPLSMAAINLCPVFNNSLTNLYAVKSIYNYSFKIDNGVCTSPYYDQKFFDEHVIVRSAEKKFFSFQVRYIFFTDQESLEMEAYRFPVFEQNEITKRCMPVTGGFDIGKYFRNLEFAFILKDEFNEFVVNDKDVLYYIKFNTEEKINFKQFKINDNLWNMVIDSRKANFGTGKKAKIDTFYNKFKGKKYILNEIKQNLLE
jgi:hypothetical protein